MVGMPTGGMQDQGAQELNPNIEPGTARRWAPRSPGLGLGLGLNRWQRGGLLQAQQGGQEALQSFLGEHQGINRRIENRMQPGGPGREAAIRDFMAGGAPPSGATLRYGRVGHPMAGPTGGPLRPMKPDINRGVPQGPETALGAAGAAIGGELGTPQPERQEAMRQARQARRGAVQAARQEFRQTRRGLRG